MANGLPVIARLAGNGVGTVVGTFVGGVTGGIIDATTHALERAHDYVIKNWRE